MADNYACLVFLLIEGMFDFHSVLYKSKHLHHAFKHLCNVSDPEQVTLMLAAPRSTQMFQSTEGLLRNLSITFRCNGGVLKNFLKHLRCYLWRHWWIIFFHLRMFIPVLFNLKYQVHYSEVHYSIISEAVPSVQLILIYSALCFAKVWTNSSRDSRCFVCLFWWLTIPYFAFHTITYIFDTSSHHYE